MNKRFNTWGALFGLGVLLTANGLAHAVVKTWTNPVSGTFTDGTKWTPLGAPVAGDDIVITTPGTYTVTYVAAGANNTFNSLTLGGAAGTQTLVNPAYTLNLTTSGNVNANGVLQQNAGSIGGAGAITIDGTFNYNGGAVGGAGALNVSGGGTLNLGGINKTLQRTLTNDGTINWLSGTGNLSLGAANPLTNNGTFTINTNNPIQRSGAGTASIINNGTFNKGGGGTTQLNIVAFTNAGTSNLNSGSLTTVNSAYAQNSGSTNFLGGNLSSPAPVNVTGGTVTGTGTITGSVSNTGGTITPGTGVGGIGTLNVTGNYTQGAGGAFNVDVTGPATFDVLNVTGSATLAGALNTNVTSVAGAPFTILTYASRSGVFAPVNNNGVSVGTQYNATNLQLVAAVLTAKITVPVDGTYVNAPARIRGEFTRSPLLGGNTGLASVQITIVENQTGLYWNGSAFVAGPVSFPAEAVDAPSGTFASNHGPGTLDVTDGYDYTVSAVASDSNGQSITTAPVTVTADITRPTVTADNVPANGSKVTSLNDPITGTASDPNSTNGTNSSSGLNHVGLFLRRQSDGTYWNGTHFQVGLYQLVDNVTTAPDSGATVNYSIGGLPAPGPATNQLAPGIYVLSVTSYDNALNNSGGGSVTRSFTVVPAVPDAPVQSLKSASKASALAPVADAESDSSAGNS